MEDIRDVLITNTMTVLMRSNTLSFQLKQYSVNAHVPLHDVGKNNCEGLLYLLEYILA
jgi:hypothetical protein